MPPNKGMQRTALCAREIGAILKVGTSPTVFAIYQCAAADAQPVRRFPSYHMSVSTITLLSVRNFMTMIDDIPSHRAGSALWDTRSRSYVWWVIGTFAGTLCFVLLPSLAVRVFASVLQSVFLLQSIDLLSACLWAFPQWLVLRHFVRRSVLWFAPIILGWFLITSGGTNLSLWRAVAGIVVMTIGQWLILWQSRIPA